MAFRNTRNKPVKFFFIMNSSCMHYKVTRCHPTIVGTGSLNINWKSIEQIPNPQSIYRQASQYHAFSTDSRPMQCYRGTNKRQESLDHCLSISEYRGLDQGWVYSLRNHVEVQSEPRCSSNHPDMCSAFDHPSGQDGDCFWSLRSTRRQWKV